MEPMISEMIEKLNWRYATKKFDPNKKISEEDLNEMLDAARLAPSSFGFEPWKFIVIKDKELREKLRGAGMNQSQITDASAFVVLAAKKDFSEVDIEAFIERVAKTKGQEVSDLQKYKEMMLGFRKGVDANFMSCWTKQQTYIALGFLLFSATMKKIDACPMEGFDPGKFDEILGLTDYTSCVLCTLGYRAEDDKAANAKKVRYDREDVVDVR